MVYRRKAPRRAEIPTRRNFEAGLAVLALNPRRPGGRPRDDWVAERVTAMSLVRAVNSLAVGLALTLSFAAATGRPAGPALRQVLSEARSDLVEKTERYKSGIETLLVFLREDIAQLTKKLAQSQALFDQGYISKIELEAARKRLDQAVQRCDEQERELEAANRVLVEAMAAELASSDDADSEGDTPSILRYHGTHPWSLEETSAVANFFWKRFGRELPISAYGQTATHDALGFDHRNQIDVAVSPASPEGKALMRYLREHAISFIGFAGAVAGSATGAHIHLGPPSGRKN